ncbi:MAG: AAA family ATPase [Fusobacteriaceae bacterium]
MKKLEKIDFLSEIIPVQCQRGDHYILAINNRKVDKGWRDIPFKYINEKKLKRDLTDFFKEYSPKVYDLYFCPVSYAGNRRRKADVNPSKYLWQDIDEKEDIKELLNSEYKPSYLWESSPNKYQGLWELDNYLDSEEMALVNPWLSNEIGCDSCHDIGHVIRIPGTINNKYNNKPKVHPAKKTNKIHRKTLLIKTAKKSQDNRGSSSDTVVDYSNMDAAKILERYNIKGQLRDVLTAPEPTGDRSDKLWYIQNKLYERGLKLEEIIFLIKSSVWNKYKGRPDEHSRLLAEVEKIMTKAGKEGVPLSRIDKDSESKDNRPSAPSLKFQTFGQVMGTLDQPQGWLVEGFWGRRSHGIVAGQPKVFKSTFVQDLAVSVASGRPFLGEYKVHEPGPVLIVQNENTVGMIKDRNEKMMKHKGLVGKVDVKGDRLKVRFAEDLPICYVNQSGFNFDDQGHLEAIENMIKEVKPVLVVFDPLYLMFGGDINSAKDLQRVLYWLLQIKIKYKTAIILVHHYNKGSDANRGGQKMLGSVTLHGWVESAWYMRRNIDKERMRGAIDANIQIDEPSLVIMEREFRQAGSYPEIELSIKMGEYGTSDYEVSAEIYQEDSITNSDSNLSKQDLVKETLYHLLRQSTIPLTKREWINSISSEQLMGLSQKKIKDLIDELIQENYVINLGVKGYIANEKEEYTAEENK